MDKKPFFKIQIKFDKIFYITFFLTYLFVLLCECEFLPFSTRGYSVVALFFIFFSLVRFEIRENLIYDIFVPILNSIIFTYVFQIMLSADPSLLNEKTLVGNIALNASLTFLFLIFSNRLRISLTLSNLVLFIFVFIDYLVISFRGSEIRISDFYSVKTAASVVSQYKIPFTTRLNYSIIVFLFVLFVLWATKITHKSRKNQLPRITGALFLGISIFTVSWCMNNSTNYMQQWAYEGTKYNGATYNLLIEARDSKIVKPEGYSSENASKILSQYPATESADDIPNIIVIMSEAFSDLSVLGEINTNVEPLEFFSSLENDVTKGYALASVHGGNTAVSEWEFLTGNTQAFLPYGSVAYQQYIKDKPNTIIDVMKENNYTTIAMHPFLPTGWKRNVVYDVFGFDEIYFKDDLTNDSHVRGFVSDASLFRDIIERFEKKEENEKIFNFCITMQNHGGYEFGSFDEDVIFNDGSCLSANQYLTLLKKSDEALKDLIEYFENVEENTMIVFFGDHQPGLSSDFYKTVMGEEVNSFIGAEKKHVVPFMIWTNYDTEEETVSLTSLNYLSTIMMEKAGIGLTPYFSYLSSLSKKIPAINFYGYYSISEGTILRTSEAVTKEKEIMNEYRMLQYHNMFG